MSFTGYSTSTPPLIWSDIQVSNIAVNKKIQTPFEVINQETNSSTSVESSTTSFCVNTQTFTTAALGTTSFSIVNPNLILNNNCKITFDCYQTVIVFLTLFTI